MKKAFYHPDMVSYDFGRGHPFRGERFKGFIKAVKSHGLPDTAGFDFSIPEYASFEDLLLVHTKEYVATVQKMEKVRGYLSPDTYVLPGMVESARLMVGSALSAARFLAEGGNMALTFGGFHHAGTNYGEGFCLFNDVAIVARDLINNHGFEKLMIIDTDAHQGNGTMDIFYEEDSVLFLSIHQDPMTLYPGKGFVHQVGTGPGEGYTVNIPMPMHSGNQNYLDAFNEVILPLTEEFGPEIIIRNGGSDPHFNDLLTSLNLDMDGLHMISRMPAQAAAQSGAKYLDLIASGYGADIIQRWLAMWYGVFDLPYPEEINTDNQHMQFHHSQGAIDSEFKKMMAELKNTHKNYWKVL
jgi:acetoin utilization protein AcuC